MSKDKRWIVTADAGAESIVVVWDSIAGVPMKTIASTHSRGIVSIDISSDALYIAALTGFALDTPQEVCLFEWSRGDIDDPLLREQTMTSDAQHTIKFNGANHSELTTTGNRSVCYWNWDSLHLEGYVASHPPNIRANFTCE